MNDRSKRGRKKRHTLIITASLYSNIGLFSSLNNGYQVLDRVKADTIVLRFNSRVSDHLLLEVGKGSSGMETFWCATFCLPRLRG